MKSMKINKALNAIWSYKYIILVYAIVLILTIPLFSMCKSAVPSADDFSYGYEARQAYVESGSVVKTIFAAVRNTVERYQNWQGTYSSIFLMSIQPGIFSLNLYRFAATLLLILTFLCPLILVYVLKRFIFKTNSKMLYIISALYSFITLQFWASMLEGIYWFNGAWYYTFSFEMVLIMIAVTVIFEKTASKKIRNTSYVFMFLFSFFLGGTNYPQLLMLTVGYSFFILMLFIRKNPRKWLYAANWAFMGVCIFISVIAPGNFINYEKHVNLYYTALSMIKTFTQELSSNPTITLALAVSLLSIPFITKMAKSADVKFIKPYLLAIASFLIVFSMYTPAAFIFNVEGPLRQINIRMMVMQFMIYINVINAIGHYVKNEAKKVSFNPAIAFILTIILLVSSFSNGKIMQAWSIQAQYSIMNLEVSRFTGRANEAFAQLEDEDTKYVDLSEFPLHGMLMDNINSFINYNVAGFYDKEVNYIKDE